MNECIIKYFDRFFIICYCLNVINIYILGYVMLGVYLLSEGRYLLFLIILWNILN